MEIWRWIVAWLVWLSADPVAIDLERPKAAAAVAAARASLAVDAPAPTPPAPGPKPPRPAVCSECGGKGYVVMPDGHRIACGACKAEACPDGRCPTPGASPATVSPARPAGGR
jgi:hypothetical protein